MSQFWSSLVHQLKPYVPGEQPKDKKYIKLNTNENPYPPSPKVMQAITDSTDEQLRLYPDPSCDDLKKELADYFGLQKDEVFVGNGSDEVLAFAFQTFFNPGDTILFPDITYSFYPVYCNLYQVNYKHVPVTEDFSLPVEDFFIENQGIIFPNPNAPTGKFLPLEEIERIIESQPNHVVIIDEAYIDFGGETAASLIHKYPNLLVVQTFSKSRSLAGLRIGFALGQKELIDGLERVKNSFNSYTIDRVALAAGVESLKDESYFEETRQKVINTRERVTESLIEKGFTVIPSHSNFVFISHSDHSAKELFMGLREQGVLVRYFDKPRINEYLRVSIGTDDEMDTFLHVVEDLI